MLGKKEKGVTEARTIEERAYYNTNVAEWVWRTARFSAEIGKPSGRDAQVQQQRSVSQATRAQIGKMGR